MSKFKPVLSDDWLPLEFQSGNNVPVSSLLVNLKTLKSIVEQAEQAVLQSEQVQALCKDAERYRWLRDGGNDDIGVVIGFDCVDVGSTGVAGTYRESLEGEQLDKAIDAAIEEQK